MPQNIPSKRSGPGCFGKDGMQSGNRFTVGVARVDRPHNLYRCETFENLLYFCSNEYIF